MSGSICGDLPADPRALRLSIEELERAEGLCLHEIEDGVDYLESVDLVLHEVKRLRWRPIETAPKERDAAGRLQQVLLIGHYPSNGSHTDIVQGWWCDGPPGEEGNWERWRHAFPPSHWMPVPAPPAPCDGSPEGSETRSGSTEGNSAVDEASSEVEAPASQDLKALQAEISRLSTALAESERKRVEADTVAVPRLCDVEALFAYYAVMDAGQRCHERTIAAINAYVAEAARLASTQETPNVQG